MVEQANAPAKTREEQLADLQPLPERNRYIYNRTGEPWEHMFNGRVYELAPYEVKVLPSEVAEHLHAHSIIPGTLRRKAGGGGSLTAERAVALGPGWAIAGSVKVEDDYIVQYAEAVPEDTFLVPTTTVAGAELFDRQSIPNYVDRPNVRDPGKPMHVEIVRV